MSYVFENLQSQIRARLFQALSPTPHFHSHLQIIYVLSGSSIATADNKEYLLEEGDLFVSFPYQFCFYHDQSACSGYMFSFPHDFYKDFKKLLQEHTPINPVIKKNQLPARCKTMMDYIMHKNASPTHLDKLAAKGTLLSLFSELLPYWELQPCHTNFGVFRDILIYCAERYTEPLTLETLAQEFHLNKYYLSHLFNDRLNIGFPTFVNNLRVLHSCGLLEKNCNITDIAYASGFSSIRTFNRAFSQVMHMSPREYIRQQE